MDADSIMGSDAMNDTGNVRTRGRRIRSRRRWVSALSWLLILGGLGLIATPLLQRAYAELAQAQLRAAMERELAAGTGNAGAGDGSAGGSAGTDAAAALGRGLVGVADQLLGALDPIFNRADDDPTLASLEGAAALPTRDTIAGVSRIIIEKAGVDAMVVDGTTVRHLRQGPGFYPEGSLPDLGGNVAIAGHRTTYGAWFRHLDRLEPGDLIRLIHKGVIHNYRVEWVRQIAANDWSVIAPAEEHVLTLTTCDPPGYSTYRLAVRARWIGTSELPAGGVR